MNSYVTGSTIKRLREEKGISQLQLANKIGVSSKAVSKWETAKGLPDISLLDSLAKALGVSVLELMSGNTITNKNVSGNVTRSKFYVCPVCNNVLVSLGDVLVSCCGITLPPNDAEEVDFGHQITVEAVEDEYFITVNHEMTKSHFISFLAFVANDRIQLVKLYPEGNPEARFQRRGKGWLLLYCNKHGLMKIKL